MKDLFKELEHIESVLSELKRNVELINEMPYYSIFGNESERQRDLDVVAEKEKKYLNKKFTVLEQIQKKSELLKYNISTALRDLKLIEIEKLKETV